MTTANYPINSREYTCFTPIKNELTFEKNINYLFELSYLAGLHIQGELAQPFLQGQVTCDVKEVSLQQCRQGALCNLKGRILALLDIVHWERHGFQLIVPTDLLHQTQASLAKTAMFSQVTLSPNANVQLFGFYLQNEMDTTPMDEKLPTNRYDCVQGEHYCGYHLGDNLFIFMVDNEHVKDFTHPFIKRSQWRGSLAWHALQLANKHLEIYPESRGLFLPHRIDLQHTQYLSFNKGCYKGQEIIARTHYRAKLKHGLKVFTVQTDAALQSGQKILSADGATEVGELIDYCPLGNNTYLIATSIVLEAPSKIKLEHHSELITLE